MQLLRIQKISFGHQDRFPGHGRKEKTSTSLSFHLFSTFFLRSNYYLLSSCSPSEGYVCHALSDLYWVLHILFVLVFFFRTLLLSLAYFSMDIMGGSRRLFSILFPLSSCRFFGVSFLLSSLLGFALHKSVVDDSGMKGKGVQGISKPSCFSCWFRPGS